MSLAAWPLGSLSLTAQKALADQNYAEQLEDNVATFQPEVGPPKLRRRTSLPNNLVTFTLICTSADVDTIDTFYKTTLLDGTQQFTMAHPRSTTSSTWLFAGPPKVNQTQGPLYFLMQFDLRMISQP